MAGERFLTTDHGRIRSWTERRSGWPAALAALYGPRDAGLLRLEFPGRHGDGALLRRIPWDEWFRTFDANHLVLLYQETLETGDLSTFYKLIRRGTGEAEWKAAWRGGVDALRWAA